MAGMAAALGAALGVMECANANRAQIEVSRDDDSQRSSWRVNASEPVENYRLFAIVSTRT